MKVVESTNKVADNSLLVDISDALSERDRVRFTVHTRTTLPHFVKPVLSVVRQHEEFIWLHDCIEDNDQYAGYIIPPPPPKPDFDSSREKLQRLGDGEANMTKEEFAKMKQELEAEYLAIFKKTVAMHEIFLQRLAAHEKFRDDNNFKIFLEYENELAVRSKSKKEKIAGSIQNIGKSLTDFVITTSQIAATTSASTSLLVGHSSPNRSNLSTSGIPSSTNRQTLASIDQLNSNNPASDINHETTNSNYISKTTDTNNQSTSKTNLSILEQNNSTGDGNNNQQQSSNINDDYSNEDILKEEQYFEKERLFLALYHDSIRDAAIQADKVTQFQKALADSYLHISQQLIKLASIEVVPITSQTRDSSTYVSCPLPSLTMPSQHSINLQASSPTFLPSISSLGNGPIAGTSSSNMDLNQKPTNSKLSEESDLGLDDFELEISDDLATTSGGNNKRNNINSRNQSDKSLINGDKLGVESGRQSKKGCANDHTSEGLKQLLLYVSDYLEQAKKIETRIASDEDLKLTDSFLYYKRDTVAAQNLLTRRLRFMSEYESATKNLEKARQKGRTQMQYADVIQKQAKENFISISKLAKQELVDYKQRRVTALKKAFNDLVELELKQLRAHSQLIRNCLDACNGLTDSFDASKIVKNPRSTSSGGVDIKGEPGAKLTSNPSKVAPGTSSQIDTK